MYCKSALKVDLYCMWMNECWPVKVQYMVSKQFNFPGVFISNEEEIKRIEMLFFLSD